MRSERGELTGDEQALAVRLRALVPAPESVDSAVAEIIASVRSGGDEALNEYTRALDTRGADPPALRQMIEVFEEVDGPVLAIEEVPKENVSAYGIIDAE